ncbi:MAG: hypothetical protein J6T60_07135 [Bacteroidales bacterium]|nr:hypothetical protein [Bacteroidales bacterium]
MATFSERNQINIEPVEISIRFDAPPQLRAWLLPLVKRLKYSIKSFRDIVCQMSYQPSNPSNWGENSFMESEIQELLNNCQWNYIYDIIEETYKQLPANDKAEFLSNINNFFISNGYGWKLDKGLIVSRGDDAFEQSINNAVGCISTSNPDAHSEIKKALVDISKRPEPDITGAVQHSMAALECLCRAYFSDSKSNLKMLINKYRDRIPKPLDEVMERLFGFASNHGRHLKEGGMPTFKDAELTVHICASLIVYFKKLSESDNNSQI